jgi:hypothetical protein
MKKKYLSHLLALAAAIIMLQTLYFKFTAHPDSVYIFSTLHIEPFGRIGTGLAEVAASLLLLLPATRIWGALLSIGIMLGAVVAHLLFLGIAVQGDGGKLFSLALIVLICASVLLWLDRALLSNYLLRLKAQK